MQEWCVCVIIIVYPFDFDSQVLLDEVDVVIIQPVVVT